MKMLFNLLVIFTLALLSGCAFSRTEMKVDYSPSIRATALSNTSEKTVFVSQIKDERDVPDPLVIFQKRNLYGKTTGSYAADRPVADIFREGLLKALESRNYRPSATNTNFDLHTTLQELDYEFIQGFWSGTLKTKMTARFILTDKSSGKEAWRDTITGRSSIDCSVCANYIDQAVKTTMDDIISKFLDNKSFQELFR